MRIVAHTPIGRFYSIDRAYDEKEAQRMQEVCESTMRSGVSMQLVTPQGIVYISGPMVQQSVLVLEGAEE